MNLIDNVAGAGAEPHTRLLQEPRSYTHIFNLATLLPIKLSRYRSSADLTEDALGRNFLATLGARRSCCPHHTERISS